MIRFHLCHLILLFRHTAIFVLLLLFSFTAQAEITQQKRDNTYKQLENFANVLAILQNSYVDDVDPKTTIEGGISGMMQTLDPHSVFLNEEDFKELQTETSGSFTGIGVEVTVIDGLLTVVSPIEGTPGDKAGLRAKDIIIEIDGKDTRDMSSDRAIKMLRGPKGSSVILGIQRENTDSVQHMTIVRDIISVHSVKSLRLTDNFIYSRISAFQLQTAQDLHQDIVRLQKNSHINGMILDLRNNPGGLLDQAVDVSDLFLQDGMIVYTKGRVERQNQQFHATSTESDCLFPIVLLVNEGSASASEIVAGALQAHKRATVVGTTTFGKGSVQTIIPLPNGTGIKLTTARYYTPDGISIHNKGIIPDITIESNSDRTKKTVHEDSIPEIELILNKSIRERMQSDKQLQTAFTLLSTLSSGKTQ